MAGGVVGGALRFPHRVRALPVEGGGEGFADVLDERGEFGRCGDALGDGGGEGPAVGGVGLGVGEGFGEGACRCGGVAVLEGPELGGLTLRHVGDVRGGLRHTNPLKIR
jgi:hypothetical protein